MLPPQRCFFFFFFFRGGGGYVFFLLASFSMYCSHVLVLEKQFAAHLVPALDERLDPAWVDLGGD